MIIETCRNCKGTGIVTPKLLSFDEVMRKVQGVGTPELRVRTCEPVKCRVCNGSGIVKKTVGIEITIEPTRLAGVILK